MYLTDLGLTVLWNFCPRPSRNGFIFVKVDKFIDLDWRSIAGLLVAIQEQLRGFFPCSVTLDNSLKPYLFSPEMQEG